MPHNYGRRPARKEKEIQMKRKTLNVRVPEELAQELETIAAYDDVAVADVVREATQKLIASKYADPEFKARVLEQAEKTRQLLERLGEHESAKGYDLRESTATG
jgi:hypothetical protein